MKIVFASALLCGALLVAPAMAQNNSDPNAVGNAGGQFQAQGGTPNANLSSTAAMNTTASPSSTNDAATAALPSTERHHRHHHHDDER